MNHVSANNEHHIPLHVKPIQSKKGSVTNAKVMIILKHYKSGIYSFVENLKFKFRHL
jgi:hypothetical protein